jgi:orotate phosphoribosyltransferase
LSLAYPYDIVAIHTVNPKILEKRCKAIYFPNTNVSNGNISEDYVLYDDVITTGKSMLKAINYYNKKPMKCICIVDRRDEAIANISCKGWNLNVISIIKVRNELSSY